MNHQTADSVSGEVDSLADRASLASGFQNNNSKSWPKLVDDESRITSSNGSCQTTTSWNRLNAEIYLSTHSLSLSHDRRFRRGFCSKPSSPFHLWSTGSPGASRLLAVTDLVLTQIVPTAVAAFSEPSHLQLLVSARVLSR